MRRACRQQASALLRMRFRAAFCLVPDRVAGIRGPLAAGDGAAHMPDQANYALVNSAGHALYLPRKRHNSSLETAEKRDQITASSRTHVACIANM